MSKLDELIKKLCSNGVEYKKLQELCNTITTGKLNANAMDKDGKYPFFTCDSKPSKINEYAFDEEAILISGNGSQVGHINYYKGKFNAYQRTYVLYDFNGIEVKYLLHYLGAYLKEYILINSKKGSVPYITLPILQNFRVPVPTIEVQNEIVRILDNFTELESELESELEARKKQYEYYRDEVFKFKNNKNVEYKKLGEIAIISRGGNFQKKDFVSVGVPCIHYGQIYMKYGLYADKVFTFIPESIARKSKIAKPNDIVMAVTSENVEDVCKCVAWTGKENIAVSGHTAIIHSEINAKYLSYYFHTNMFYMQKLKYVHGTKVIEFTPKNLENIEIPVVPKEEQEKIVSILDRFDKLCNDISDGLPAEIEARRKQYEYYRDKLLNFKELKIENKE